MKYFCPLENVGKIEGRERSDITTAKTTTINGWEISSDGIYAGSNDTLTDLPIASKNWSIDKNGNSNFNNIKINNFFETKQENNTQSFDIFYYDGNTKKRVISYLKDSANNELSFSNGLKFRTDDLQLQNFYFNQTSSSSGNIKYLDISTNKTSIFSISENAHIRFAAGYLQVTKNNNIYQYNYPLNSGTLMTSQDYRDIEIKKITFPYDCWFFDISGNSYRTREEKSMLLYDNQLLNSQITIPMGNSAQGSKDRVTILETYLDKNGRIMIKYTLGDNTTIKEIALSSIGKLTDIEDKKPKTTIFKLIAAVK